MSTYTLLTDIGLTKVTAFATGGPAIDITEFRIGDAWDGANYIEPDATFTDLTNTVYTGSGTNLVKNQDANEFSIDCIIPPDEGGFTIRELGLFDSDGDLIGIAWFDPAQPKPVLSAQSSMDLILQPSFTMENADAINITVNPASLVTQSQHDNDMATKVDKAGDTMTGNLSMSDNNITGVDKITAETAVVTKVEVAGDAQFGLAGAPSQGIEIGGIGTDYALIDFHSNGSNHNDYDVRVSSFGGENGTDGKGNFNIEASTAKINSEEILRDITTVLANNGETSLSNNLKFRWGRTGSIAAHTAHTVNFVPAFDTACFVLIPVGASTATVDDGTRNAHVIDAGSGQIINTTVTAIDGTYWLAIGE